MNEYAVIARPADRQDAEKNDGGVIVLLSNGTEETEYEVARVAFIRRNSRNPEIPFEEQLAIAFDDAQEAADALNGSLDDLERMEAEKLEEAKRRVREIVGQNRKKPLS